VEDRGRKCVHEGAADQGQERDDSKRKLKDMVPHWPTRVRRHTGHAPKCGDSEQGRGEGRPWNNRP
jgi:hypothetical protein